MGLLTFTVTLTQIQCPNCGGTFAISLDYKNEAYRLGNFKKCWSCPYCKIERGFGESEIDRLNKQITGMKNTETWLRERSESAEKKAEHFRKSRDGMKGVLTKVKNRIKHGVCPCCNRTFTNLARHMSSQHPDFAKVEEPKES